MTVKELLEVDDVSGTGGGIISPNDFIWPTPINPQQPPPRNIKFRKTIITEPDKIIKNYKK